MKLDLSTNLQNKVLSLVVFSSEFMTVMRDRLTPDHFQSKEQWTLCSLAFSFFDRYQEAAGDCLSNEVEQYSKKIKMAAEKKALLLDLLDELRPLSASEEKYVTDEVVRFIKHAEMRRLLEEFIPKYEAGDYNLDDLIDPVTQLQRGIERDRFESNDSLASTRRRAIARIQREEIPEVATLIAPLDSTMVGIRPGQLGTIMSPSGIGKSFMMVHLGKAAVMQSCGVFHYTLEMSEEEILDRYDQMILGATERELRFPDVMKRLVDKTNRMLNGGGRLQVVYLPFGYGGQQSGTKIEAFRRDFKRRVAEAGRPNLVLIDYGDLLAKDGKSRYEEQGTVWRALKAFAVEEKVAVWAATQSARSGVGVKRVTELEVADSYEKVRVSDIFIGFNRNIVYNRNQNEWMEIDADHNENVVRLFVVKHRGRRDKYEVKFACDFARGIFYSKVDTASIGAGQSTKPQMGRVKAVFGSKKA